MATPTTHLRVLHLEDDPNDSALVRRLLERDGFTVSFQAVTNRRDFELAMTAQIDLVLCDYTIPGFDGLTALHLFRERWKETPFIFVSGSIGEDFAIEALQAGATDYVLKDRMSRLVPAVRRAIAEAANRDALAEAENEARAAIERTNRLLAHLPFLLYTMEGYGVFRLSWVGQNAEAITGYTADHIVKQKDFWRSRIHPEDADRVQAELATLLKRGRVTSEYRWQKADGTWLTFIDQQIVARDDTGTLRDVVGSWHDVTQSE